jgi:hypothetical protein
MERNPFRVGDFAEAVAGGTSIARGETFLVTGVTGNFIQFTDADGDDRERNHNQFKLVNRERSKCQEPKPAAAMVMPKGWGAWA